MDEQQRQVEAEARAQEIQAEIELATAFGLRWDEAKAAEALDQYKANIEAIKASEPERWAEAEAQAEITRAYMKGR